MCLGPMSGSALGGKRKTPPEKNLSCNEGSDTYREPSRRRVLLGRSNAARTEAGQAKDLISEINQATSYVSLEGNITSQRDTHASQEQEGGSRHVGTGSGPSSSTLLREHTSPSAFPQQHNVVATPNHILEWHSQEDGSLQADMLQARDGSHLERRASITLQHGADGSPRELVACASALDHASGVVQTFALTRHGSLCELGTLSFATSTYTALVAFSPQPGIDLRTTGCAILDGPTVLAQVSGSQLVVIRRTSCARGTWGMGEPTGNPAVLPGQEAQCWAGELIRISCAGGPADLQTLLCQSQPSGFSPGGRPRVQLLASCRSSRAPCSNLVSIRSTLSGWEAICDEIDASETARKSGGTSTAAVFPEGKTCMRDDRLYADGPEHMEQPHGSKLDKRRAMVDHMGPTWGGGQLGGSDHMGPTGLGHMPAAGEHDGPAGAERRPPRGDHMGPTWEGEMEGQGEPGQPSGGQRAVGTSATAAAVIPLAADVRAQAFTWGNTGGSPSIALATEGGSVVLRVPSQVPGTCGAVDLASVRDVGHMCARREQLMPLHMQGHLGRLAFAHHSSGGLLMGQCNNLAQTLRQWSWPGLEPGPSVEGVEAVVTGLTRLALHDTAGRAGRSEPAALLFLRNEEPVDLEATMLTRVHGLQRPAALLMHQGPGMSPEDSASENAAEEAACLKSVLQGLRLRLSDASHALDRRQRIAACKTQLVASSLDLLGEHCRATYQGNDACADAGREINRAGMAAIRQGNDACADAGRGIDREGMGAIRQGKDACADAGRGMNREGMAAPAAQARADPPVVEVVGWQEQYTEGALVVKARVQTRPGGIDLRQAQLLLSSPHTVLSSHTSVTVTQDGLGATLTTSLDARTANFPVGPNRAHPPAIHVILLAPFVGQSSAAVPQDSRASRASAPAHPPPDPPPPRSPDLPRLPAFLLPPAGTGGVRTPAARTSPVLPHPGRRLHVQPLRVVMLDFAALLHASSHARGHGVAGVTPDPDAQRHKRDPSLRAGVEPQLPETSAGRGSELLPTAVSDLSGQGITPTHNGAHAGQQHNGGGVDFGQERGSGDGVAFLDKGVPDGDGRRDGTLNHNLTSTAGATSVGVAGGLAAAQTLGEGRGKERAKTNMGPTMIASGGDLQRFSAEGGGGQANVDVGAGVTACNPDEDLQHGCDLLVRLGGGAQILTLVENLGEALRCDCVRESGSRWRLVGPGSVVTVTSQGAGLGEVRLAAGAAFQLQLLKAAVTTTVNEALGGASVEGNPVSAAEVDALAASVDALSSEVAALLRAVEGELFARSYSSTDSQNCAVEPQQTLNPGQTLGAPGFSAGVGDVRRADPADSLSYTELRVLKRLSDTCVSRLWAGR